MQLFVHFFIGKEQEKALSATHTHSSSAVGPCWFYSRHSFLLCVFSLLGWPQGSRHAFLSSPHLGGITGTSSPLVPSRDLLTCSCGKNAFTFRWFCSRCSDPESDKEHLISFPQLQHQNILSTTFHQAGKCFDPPSLWRVPALSSGCEGDSLAPVVAPGYITSRLTGSRPRGGSWQVQSRGNTEVTELWQSEHLGKPCLRRFD